MSNERVRGVRRRAPLGAGRCDHIAMTAEPSRPLELAIADIREALAALRHTRDWHVRADAIRDADGATIAWHPASPIGHAAFRYICTVRPEVLESLLAELDRLKAEGRRPARRAAPPPDPAGDADAPATHPARTRERPDADAA